MIDLSIIIVNWNTKKLLLDCLASIFNQNENLNYEIIVVDNGSTDGSVTAVKQLMRHGLRVRNKNKQLTVPKTRNPQTRNSLTVKLIENKENLGFAKANNQAIQQAIGEYILLLNTDTKIINNALKKLVDFARSDKKIGLVGPRLLNFNGTPQPSVAPFFTLFKVFVWLFTGDRFLYSSPNKAIKADWLMGAALMAKKEMIEKIGGLDEGYFMYVEDIEWCYRAKKAGWSVWFYPAAQIIHLVRGSSPEGKQRAILGIYKGLLRFYEKNFASWQLSVLKFLLLTKAVIAWLIGVVTVNNYLKKTYGEAIKLVGQA